MRSFAAIALSLVGAQVCHPASGACANAKELQRCLKDMDVIQREEYPSLHGRSRLAVYPGLKHLGRAIGISP